MVLGLFYSKNTFGKAAGMWILLWIFYLYPTVNNGFSMHYILVWMCVGFCFSKKMRELTDGQIKEFLNENKKQGGRKINFIQPAAVK
jgi:hypothetical protein